VGPYRELFDMLSKGQRSRPGGQERSDSGNGSGGQERSDSGNGSGVTPAATTS
jgi:hypothetical protein